MYEIHRSECFVISYGNRGEADRTYCLLTEKHGMLYAKATSVRKEKSKLKHFLQELCLSEVEFVSGKSGFQITGGELVENLARTLDREAARALARLLQLSRRFLVQSEEELSLFPIIKNTVTNARSCVDGHIDLVEMLGTARILNALGYFDPDFSQNLPAELFENGEIGEGQIRLLEKHKTELGREINKGIQESQV